MQDNELKNILGYNEIKFECLTEIIVDDIHSIFKTLEMKCNNDIAISFLTAFFVNALMKLNQHESHKLITESALFVNSSDEVKDRFIKHVLKDRGGDDE